ncbi:MAG: hypothetical protein JWL63_516 [Rhodocyclales bacterium]|nr:hypothetical protein [Rhodocyclales bacterium]
MNISKRLIGIYDFEVFPFALGDVLTWNVQTAIRCEEAGRQLVDIYICADEKYPAGVHQREMVNAQNFDLFFSELYTAFGTHPCLGNIHIFRSREELIERIQDVSEGDYINNEIVKDYLGILNYRETTTISNKLRFRLFNRIKKSLRLRRFIEKNVPASMRRVFDAVLLPNNEVINNYLIKYISSHGKINEFAKKTGRIPLLKKSLGCAPDIEEFLKKKVPGKKIVPFHLRLRRLDAGYGGGHSYGRDSDFLEWYDFLADAAIRYPNIQFVALGRLQEKPLSLLRLPNVTSLRALGMGLGHELTLMLESDLFIGSSSGFAAMANFSKLPYFITRMNENASQSYDIPHGAVRLPFAQNDQMLVYEEETSDLLMQLLTSHAGPVSHTRPPECGDHLNEGASQVDLNVRFWLNEKLKLKNSASTTSRFFNDDKYRYEETAYLLFANLEKVRDLINSGSRELAIHALNKIQNNFPDICDRLPEFRVFLEFLAEEKDAVESISKKLEVVSLQMSGFVGTPCTTDVSDPIGWKPTNYQFGGICKTLPEETQPALAMRGGQWKIGTFVSDNAHGKINLCFDARMSTRSVLHPIYIFEDGIHRPAGDFLVESEWQSFSIPITAMHASELQIQIDQRDDSQWLEVRRLCIFGAKDISLATVDTQRVDLSLWEGEPGILQQESEHDEREWLVQARRGYVRTPPIDWRNDKRGLICFEVKVDHPSLMLTPIYLWEGEQYRQIAAFAFSAQWHSYLLPIELKEGGVFQLQVDYPEGVGVFSIRDCFIAKTLSKDVDLVE